MKKLPLLSLIFLAGCAKVGTTIPGESSNIAIGTGYTEIAALEMAVVTAEKHCDKHAKRHVIDGQKTTYKGILDEQSRNATDTASVIASYAGVYIPPLGNDDDYQVKAEFRCL